MNRAFIAIFALFLLAVGAIVWVMLRPDPPAIDRPNFEPPVESRAPAADAGAAPSDQRPVAPPGERAAEAPPRAGAERPEGAGARPARNRREREPAPEEPPAGSISGRVRDAQGRPIAGAVIYRIDPEATNAVASDPTFRTVSDSEGRWSLPVAEDAITDLGAAKIGYVPALLRDVALHAGAGRDGIDLVLGDGAAIAGRISDPRNRGVAGVRVVAIPSGVTGVSRSDQTLFFPGRSLLGRTEVAALTDEEGHYSIRGLALGSDYELRPDTGKVLLVPGTEADLERRVTAPAEGIDFKMVRSVQVSVRVLDAMSGEPVPSFSVTLTRKTEAYASSTSTSVANSPDGIVRFERFVTPGRYLVGAEAKGYEPAALQEEDLGDPETPYELAVRLRPIERLPAATLRLILKDETGAPVPRAHAYAMHIDQPAAPGRHGSAQVVDGTGDVKDLEPGRYSISIRPQGPYLQTVTVEADARANEVTPVEVVVPGGGRIAIDVKDPGGKYVSEVRVHVAAPDGNQVSTVFEVKTATNQSTSRSDGIFYPGRAVTTCLPPGVYTVTFWCNGYQTRTETVEVRRGEETALQVYLDPL